MMPGTISAEIGVRLVKKVILLRQRISLLRAYIIGLADMMERQGLPTVATTMREGLDKIDPQTEPVDDE